VDRTSRQGAIGGRKMRPLLTLHHGLEAIRRAIGQVTRLVLGALLFAAPLFAAVAASLVAAVMVAVLVGGGALVYLPLFPVFMGFIGFYVSPHVQPQMGNVLLGRMLLGSRGIRVLMKRQGPRRGPARNDHSLSCTSPENARRKFAAWEALLAAVKIALSSSLRREIHDAM
jgi:hypothetical protein